MTDRKLLALTARIVARYVEANQTSPDELPSVIGLVRESLSPREPLRPAEVATYRPSASEIRRSVRSDTIVSFLDGRPYKCLKKHIKKYGLTPEAYRTRFGLPSDYPIVAANYSDMRSALAKASGLGRHAKRKRSAAGHNSRAVHRK